MPNQTSKSRGRDVTLSRRRDQPAIVHMAQRSKSNKPKCCLGRLLEGIGSFLGKLLEHLDSRVGPGQFWIGDDSVMAIGRVEPVKTSRRRLRDGKVSLFEAYMVRQMLKVLQQ